MAAIICGLWQLLPQVVGAKNHLRLLVWLLLGSIFFFGVLSIFWHSLLAHLFELQLGLGRA